MNSRIVVGLGEILWDIFPDRKILGGAPANFAYHASQFGFNGYIVSAIGEDLLGQEVLASLKQKELNYLIETTDYPTGTVQVSLSGAGIPQYEITENVAWDHIPFTARTQNLAANTVAACFGLLAQRDPHSRETIQRFLAAMPEDSIRILDINLRQNYYSKESMEESMRLCQILKINDEELIVVSSMLGFAGDEESVSRRIMKDYGLKILILTKGTEGSIVYTADETSFQPTPRVHVADTVGAGDSFTAAFISGYLNGMRVEEAHHLAAEVSAYVCQQQGAMPVLPDAHRYLFR